ncbi:MAG: 3'-5' exoribonuclease YhaM family protein [Acidobacteriaceae bacterium]
MSQSTLLPTQAKTVFLGEIAKYEGQTVTDFFVVAQKQVSRKRDGAPYLSLRLSDRTGQCEARMWDNWEPCAETFQTGDILKLQVEVSGWNGRPQLTIKKLRKAAAEEYSLADFQAHTTLSIDELWTKLNSFVDSFADPFLQQLVRSFLDDPEIALLLRSAPAAKYLHHAWIGGLLEHIVSLLGLCDRVTPHYPQVHRDLVMTGAILHDIGKLEELRWSLNFDYTLEGQLLGHITLGIAMIEKRVAAIPDFPPRLRLLVEHIVLSHHGKYEFGSPKLPMTPDAILFHYLDDLDAKMYSVRTELDRSAQQGRAADEMTDWVRSLERPLLDSQAFLNEADRTHLNEADGQLDAEVTSDALPAEE